MKLGAISPSFKLMMNLICANIDVGAGLKKSRCNMRPVSGGTGGRWRGDHVLVIVKAAAGYIQHEQTQQSTPHIVRFVILELVVQLFIVLYDGICAVWFDSSTIKICIG